MFNIRGGTSSPTHKEQAFRYRGGYIYISISLQRSWITFTPEVTRMAKKPNIATVTPRTGNPAPNCSLA